MTTVETSFEKVRRKMVAARIEVMSQLARFSKKEITQQPSSDDWSPLQIAHHIYVADGMALEQMRIIQTEDNPLIIDPSTEGPRRTRESEPPTSLDSVLAGMAARREEIFEYLSSLPDDAWVRPFRHAEWGQLKFYQMVNILPMHDNLHAQQLADSKQKMINEQN